ncbi:NAD(P)/FAD-dependent oxidoreductase [Aquabacterium sp. A7-Y]|uniref:NAD(P)/FAD-dependent oxidoreductase n=1 Tax=Aquabacterium sp. A7-Y TaxID=1349605 RepID=UPI00223D2ACA|nr:NAD(P)/FAD-dependent oxidoreductase [Aquabacterium sp. A7-Y]MCW7537655.1 NAD(P)/FAD-dependent oxidoreductase [Aquabacterium sp. A7-Y]
MSRPAFESPAAEAATPASLHRVVIIGGGAGGLELAARLGDSAGREGLADVVLVDSALTHLWKPLLHEVAAGTLDHQETEVDYLQQARRHHFRFHLGSMAGLDRAARQVWLEPLIDEEGEEIAPRRALDYDTLVISVGSIVNDFGTPGVREHALALNTPADARRFHRRLLAACARSELQSGGPVEIVIVGGGATGVELAAELSESVAEIASYGARLQQLPQAVRLRIVEAGPRLLAAMPEHVAQTVHEDLRRAGVDVLTAQRVKEVAPDHVRLGDGSRLPAEITVWAAGIQAPPVLAQTDGLERNKLGQLVVRTTLQTTLDDAVFALGDCASCVPAPGAAPVPPRAQAAQQEARLLASSLERHLRGEPLQPFAFKDKGALVSLGRRNAVGRVIGQMTGRGFTFEGLLARLTYWGLQRQHMAALHGTARTVLATVGGWLTGRSQPRVKLH